MPYSQLEELVGTVLASRYAIEDVLGGGAVGVVFRARHNRMGRPFAIKVLRRRLTSDPKMVKRFEREAELAGRLWHPNVVPVVDTGTTDDGLHYIAMELATGVTLSELMIEAPMPTQRVIELARQLCDGLQHAHDLGLVHRDFKPDNVIVGRDERGRELARILDFGVAILRDGSPGSGEHERLTTAGIVVGTPHYMSPEQAMGLDLDPRSDLFALGLILYELVTGKLPFEGDGVDVARANMSHPTPPMGIRAPAVPVDPLLEALVRKLLAKEPADRPQSAKEVRELLDLVEHHRDAASKALDVVLPRSVPAPVPVPAPPPAHVAPPGAAYAATDRVAVRRLLPRRRIVAAAAAILVACLALLWLAIRPPAEAPAAPTSLATADEPAPLRPQPMPPIAQVAPPAEPSPPPPLAPTPLRPPVAIPPSMPHVPPSQARSPAPHPTEGAPSPTELASLYASVGRELKSLDRRKGEDSTIDLWPRYRWIRINDALVAAPDKRGQIAAMLSDLRRDIAAR